MDEEEAVKQSHPSTGIIGCVLSSFVFAFLFDLLLFAIFKNNTKAVSEFLGPWRFITLYGMCLIVLIAGSIFRFGWLKNWLTVTKDVTPSDVLGIIWGNALRAIGAGIALYVSVYVAAFLAMRFKLPSLTEVIVMWLTGLAVDYIYAQQGLEIVAEKIEYVQEQWDLMAGFIVYMGKTHGFYLCYGLAFFDGVMDDLGMHILKRRIIGVYSRIKRRTEKLV